MESSDSFTGRPVDSAIEVKRRWSVSAVVASEVSCSGEVQNGVQSKIREPGGDVAAKLARANMGRWRRLVGIGGVDYGKASGRREQVIQMQPIDVVFDQVVEDVQREGRVRADKPCAIRPGVRIIVKEAFGRIAPEAVGTASHGRWRYVQAEVPRIAGETQLVAVSAPEFHHGTNLALFDKLVEHACFELRQAPIRSGSGIAVVAITPVPIRGAAPKLPEAKARVTRNRGQNSGRETVESGTDHALTG